MNGGIYLPLWPWIYEIGNSLISSLAVPLLIILCRFFAIEILNDGPHGAYQRVRFRLGLAVSALVLGTGAYRSWTWWGHVCTETQPNASGCYWMMTATWSLVPVASIAVELAGMLCMIRILVPGAWGRWAWIISAALAVAWSLAWFSGWSDVVAYLRG